jgi:hypothetical protein
MPFRSQVMTNRISILVTAALLFSGAACKKEGDETPTKSEKGQKAAPAEPSRPGELPRDKAYGEGDIEVAVMELKTTLDVPGLAPPGEVGEAVERAQKESAMTQKLVVSDDRGKLLFTTEDFYIPEGTQLRYNPEHGRYVLAAPEKKEYWALTGSELANLMEGGPAMERSDYEIEITDTEEEAEVAGYEAVRTNATISLKWAVKTEAGRRTGDMKVKLAIWHTAEGKLRDAWGDMMVDFLTVPFQDDAGRKIVQQLKQRISFPVKWVMEFDSQGQEGAEGKKDKEQGASPKLVSEAQEIDIEEVRRTELASPPPGYEPASGPYEFGPGGQTASAELLGKIPAKPGEPPQNKSGK